MRRLARSHVGYVVRYAALRLLNRRVRTGGFVFLGPHVRLDVAPGSRIELGDRVRIGADSMIACSGEVVTIGARTVLGHHTEIDCKARVELGADCLASAYLHVVDYDHGYLSDELIRAQPLAVTPIAIGDDVWVGRNVTVTRGATIGRHSVVGAHAVVRGTFPAGIVLAGVPVRAVRSIEAWS